MTAPTTPFRPIAPQTLGGYTPTNQVIPRFGMYAGPGYAGGVKLADNAIPTVSTWNVVPVNFIDQVTRAHDINYTWIEKVYSGSDKESKLAKDRAFWQADKEMLTNVMAWRPDANDWISTMYRDALIKGFALKATRYDGIDLQKDWTALGQLDKKYADTPGYWSSLFPGLGALNTGGKYQLYGMEALTGSGLNVQQMLLFNQHITSAQASSYLRNQDDGVPGYDSKVVIPQRDSLRSDRFFADVNIGGKTVRMEMFIGATGHLVSFTQETFNASTSVLLERKVVEGVELTKDAYGQSTLNESKTVFTNGNPTTTTATFAAPTTQGLTTSARASQIETLVRSGTKKGHIQRRVRSFNITPQLQSQHGPPASPRIRPRPVPRHVAG